MGLIQWVIIFTCIAFVSFMSAIYFNSHDVQSDEKAQAIVAVAAICTVITTVVAYTAFVAWVTIQVIT